MAERVDHGGRNGFVGDGKIFDGARGGRAVQGVGRHLHLAHRVAFDAEARSWNICNQRTSWLVHERWRGRSLAGKSRAMILDACRERNGEIGRVDCV